MPEGAENPSGRSGCAGVIVDEPAAGRFTSDRLDSSGRNDVVNVVGRSLIEAAVGSMYVGALEVLLDEEPELALVPDELPVEKLVAQGANPSLSKRVRLW